MAFQSNGDDPGRVVPTAQVADVTRNYLCANCWEPLAEYRVKAADGSGYISVVRCATADCQCEGFVTRRWVEQRESQARAEAHIIRQTLVEAGYLPPTPRQAPEEILAELGYGG